MSEYRTKEEILDLFCRSGVEYLPRPRIEYARLEDFDPRSTRYYRKNRKEFEDLTGRYEDAILSSRTAAVYVKDAGDMGLGLFVSEPVPEGAFIGEYSGIIREARECTEETEEGGYATDYSWDYPECFRKVELEIDASRAGNEMRYVNHSFFPNLVVEHTVAGGRWAVFFVAARNIRQDEQLFADYGEAYWSGGDRTLVLE